MPLVGCISWSLVGRNWQLVVPSERTSEFRGKRSKLRFWSEELKVLFWIWLMLILKPSWHSAWLVTWSTRAPCCFCQHARGTIKAALTIITLAGVEDLLRLQCWHQRRTLIFAFFLLYCFTAASSRVSFVVIKKSKFRSRFRFVYGLKSQQGFLARREPCRGKSISLWVN